MNLLDDKVINSDGNDIESSVMLGSNSNAVNATRSSAASALGSDSNSGIRSNDVSYELRLGQWF